MPWAPSYIEVEDLAVWLEDYTDDRDEIYADAIEAASRLIDRSCNRQFGSVTPAQDRTFRQILPGRYEIDDLMTSVGLLVVDTDGHAVTDYHLTPTNGPQTGKPWTRLVMNDSTGWTSPELTITASWGWTEIPGAVKMACRIQAARFAKRKDTPYGISGSPQEQGELRLLARLDPDVAVSLRAFQRQRLAS